MVYRRTATLSITASCKHGIHFDLTGRHPPSLIENRLRPFENFQTIKPTWSFFPTRTDGPALSRTTALRSACHQVSLHLLRIKLFFLGGVLLHLSALAGVQQLHPKHFHWDKRLFTFILQYGCGLWKWRVRVDQKEIKHTCLNTWFCAHGSTSLLTDHLVPQQPAAGAMADRT